MTAVLYLTGPTCGSEALIETLLIHFVPMMVRVILGTAWYDLSDMLLGAVESILAVFAGQALVVI